MTQIEEHEVFIAETGALYYNLWRGGIVIGRDYDYYPTSSDFTFNPTLAARLKIPLRGTGIDKPPVGKTQTGKTLVWIVFIEVIAIIIYFMYGRK